MATFSAVTAVHKTLTANVVDTITLTPEGGCNFVIVTSRGAGDIFWRIDGIDPAVAGDDAFVTLGNTEKKVTAGITVLEVRIIGAQATPYSVECVN